MDTYTYFLPGCNLFFVFVVRRYVSKSHTNNKEKLNMILLSRSEEIILLAVWKLKGNAYGVTIKELISGETGHDWTFGAIYKPLKQLLSKGYVKKHMSAPTAERGGRAKYLYTLTSSGENALRNIRKISNSIWTPESIMAFE